MLKILTSVVDGTFNKDHGIAERWARRPFHQPAQVPPRVPDKLPSD